MAITEPGGDRTRPGVRATLEQKAARCFAHRQILAQIGEEVGHVRLYEFRIGLGARIIEGGEPRREPGARRSWPGLGRNTGERHRSGHNMAPR